MRVRWELQIVEKSSPASATLKDGRRPALVPEQIQRALLGHAGQGVADGYGVGFPLTVFAGCAGESEIRRGID
jgi:hypothetical protein